MTPNEQASFIKELSKNITAELLADIRAYKIPVHWDGVELRQLLADRMAQGVFLGLLVGHRKREYNNSVLVNDL